MSLKAFHVFFLAISTLLAAGFAAWSMNAYFGHDASALYLAMGLISVASAVGLLAYGKWFLAKTKSVSYL